MSQPDFSKPRERAVPNFDRHNSTSKRGSRHEKRIAKRTGDRTVSGSGNKPGRPADVKGDVFLREAKTTKGAGRMISGKELAKIVRQALSLGRVPVMEICFEGQKLPVPNDWVLIPADDFDRLTKEGS